MADSGLSTLAIEGGVVVGFAPGANLDAHTVELVRDDIIAVVERGTGSIVLDFTNVSFASSPAIGLLVTLRLKAARTDHRLLLAGLHDNIAGVLRVMQMDKIFEIFPNVDAATAALQPA
jgi:anti-sigma B factor antagonist